MNLARTLTALFLAAAASPAMTITTAMADDAPPTATAATPPPPFDPAGAAPAVATSNAFGLDLYRALASRDAGSNLFLSPYSVAVAMTMAAEGARGETEAQMAQTLRFPSVPEAGGERAVTIQHRANAAIAERLRAAAGSTDPSARAKVADLRKQLENANAKIRELERGDDWRAAQEAAATAQKLAAEINALQSTLDRFDLRIANALWVDRAFRLVPAYPRELDRYYGTGGVSPLSIATDPEGSRNTINAWVEKNTENRIKDLIPPGALSAATRLVITNAVYFKGEWADPFDAASTREQPFTLASGSSHPAKMMLDWRATPYAAFNADGTFFETPLKVPQDESKRPPTYPGDDGFTMIEIPYKGNDLSMVLIAPRRPDGLPALERGLTAEALSGWLGRLEPRTVDIGVPRFTMESEFDLAGTLAALGMKRAFVSTASADGAEFDGVSDSTDPSNRLFVGAVRHKAWIDVTEKGTEAAAATAVMMPPGAAMRPQELIPFTPMFRADRPFLFLIRDRATGLVLFLGRCSDPG